jgi:hypothetical protein
MTGPWLGVDEAVIGRFAREAGHAEARPVIDLVQGDALLFAFLCAGLIAGFVLGFFGRAVFAPGAESPESAESPEGRGPEHA